MPKRPTHAPDRLFIFDTTLRDGEQAPGFAMSLDEKLSIARTLAALRVDVIEAGFPAASPGDFEAVQAIAREIRGPRIAGLARCVPGDIEAAARAIAPAEKQRLHVFLATSPVHMERKLKMDKDEVLRRIEQGVRLARSHCEDVEFSAEDASRSEITFLAKAIHVAIDAGASTINLPDTVGYATPAEYAELFKAVRRLVPDIDSVVLSTHCHDDLGLAVANTLAGIEQGARQVECTINGIGERAGNAALEEIVMAAATRQDRFGLQCNIDTRRLCATSRVLAGITGVQVPPNKAVVGQNAFAHESGIHQHGVLSHRSTYEIMRAEDVGASTQSLVLGKHSGRHAVRARLEELGFLIEGPAFEELFGRFKQLADRKKEILDGDLEALLIDGGHMADGPWALRSLHAASGTTGLPSAAVQMRHQDLGERAEAAVGDGQVDAAFKAMARACGLQQAELLNFQIHSATLGEDAQGRVTADCRIEGREVRGHGVSTDIVEASALAFLDAINREARSALPATTASHGHAEA